MPTPKTVLMRTAQKATCSDSSRDADTWGSDSASTRLARPCANVCLITSDTGQATSRKT